MDMAWCSSDVVIVFFLFRIRCRDDHLYMECVFSEYCQLWLGLEHIDIMIIKLEIGGTTLCSQQVGCCSPANSRIIQTSAKKFHCPCIHP
jgi:hypothetical protein